MILASLVGLAASLRGRTRRTCIESYQFPSSLYAALRKHHPELSAADCHDVVELLREWFLLCLAARKKFLSMPSQIVDEAWHAFIIDTRAYAQFCGKAFGRFLHHTPAEAMTTAKSGSRGLRRSWRAALVHEHQDLQRPQRLPRLFAVDERLKIKNGFRYQLDCSRSNGAGGYCGMHLGGASCGAGGCAAGGCGLGSESADFFSGWFGGGDSGASADGGGGSGCGGGCGGD